ncbi:MAG: Rap1a/Tai family immunity protein [Rhodospirillaceae bacterium]
MRRTGYESLVFPYSPDAFTITGPHMRFSAVATPALFALLTCVTLTSAGREAVAYQGITLARECRLTEGEAAVRCRAFIDGFIAGSQFAINGQPLPRWEHMGYQWCGPEVLEPDAVRTTLIDAAMNQSAVLHFPASLVLAQTLSAKFPCDE